MPAQIFCCYRTAVKLALPLKVWHMAQKSKFSINVGTDILF